MTTAQSNNHIYTDGSAPSNQFGCIQGGIGIAVYDENGQLTQTYSETVKGKTTNVRCEMQALIFALSIAKDGDTIHCDNDMCVKGCNLWRFKWKTGGWKKANKQPVLNADLWVQIDSILSTKSVTIKHVKGHAGIAGNEEADRLAKAAALGESAESLNVADSLSVSKESPLSALSAKHKAILERFICQDKEAIDVLGVLLGMPPAVIAQEVCS
ncbi:RNase H family protein [Grimontia hollisae]|uniref:RNase H family protein n=1 Tax=Grimontia hollisae TaxID=673 RepID=UPI00165E2C02